MQEDVPTHHEHFESTRDGTTILVACRCSRGCDHTYERSASSPHPAPARNDAGDLEGGNPRLFRPRRSRSAGDPEDCGDSGSLNHRKKADSND
jgi:hypothetical protein